MGLLDKLKSGNTVLTPYAGSTPSKLVNADKSTAANSKLHYDKPTDGYSLDGNPSTVSTSDKGDYIRSSVLKPTDTFTDALPSVLDNQPGAHYANGEKLDGRYALSAPEGRGSFVNDVP